MPKGYPEMNLPEAYSGEFKVFNRQTQTDEMYTFPTVMITTAHSAVIFEGLAGDGSRKMFMGDYDCSHMNFDADDLMPGDKGDTSIIIRAGDKILLRIDGVRNDSVHPLALEGGLMKVTVKLSSGKKAIAVGRINIELTII